MKDVIRRVKRDLYQYRWSIIGLLLYYIIVNLFFDTICPFANLTGIPCPGCGMTRALVLLLQGDLKQSVQYHPLLIPILCLVIWFCWKRYIKGENIKRSTPILITVAFALFITYFIRMCNYYPNEIPMIYRENNILHYIKLLINQ